MKKEWENAIKTSKFGGIVLDDDYVYGVGTNLAYDMMKKTGAKEIKIQRVWSSFFFSLIGYCKKTD